MGAGEASWSGERTSASREEMRSLVFVRFQVRQGWARAVVVGMWENEAAFRVLRTVSSRLPISVWLLREKLEDRSQVSGCRAVV